jgi:Tfp pilus assembly protein PilF
MQHLQKHSLENIQQWLHVIKNEISAGDIESAESSILKVQSFLEHSDLNSMEKDTVQMRLHRYRFEISLALEKPAVSELWRALEIFDKYDLNFSTLKTREEFLLCETARRVLESGFRFEFNIQSANSAFFLNKAFGIDPYCHRLHLLQARYFEANGATEEAYSSYLKCLQTGTLHVQFVNAKLETLAKSSAEKHAFLSQAKQLGPYDQEQISEKNFDPTVIHYNESSMEAADFNQQLYHRITAHSSFNKFTPFFTLQEPTEKAPIFTKTPLLLYDSLKENELPWFQTLTCQRAMVDPFRKELVLSHLAMADVTPQSLAQLSSFGQFSSASENGSLVADLFHNRHTLGSLKKAHLGRLLAALGFFSEALEVLTLKDDSNSLEDTYLQTGRIFVEGAIAQSSSLNNAVIDQSLSVFNSLDNSEESLRMRFSLALNAVVYAGQRKEIALCETWTAIASGLINEIQESGRFSDFEKSLLTSRYYRGVSYLPFVRKQLDVLASDSALCEQFALQAKPQTAKEEILYQENLFPMLESTARIASFLGRNDDAFERMKKIVTDVDPEDSKAWLQVGEYQQKRGDINSAHISYLTAASKACPLGRVAWYKAGYTAELLEKDDFAEHCYLQSLSHWPTGKSPLLRLAVLGKKSNSGLDLWANKELQLKGQSYVRS